MKSFVLLLAIFTAIQIQGIGQSKIEEIKIYTSAQCEECKNRIEKSLYKTKGVISANLDVSNKIATVIFRNNKTDKKSIQTAINNAGYDADDSPANTEAYHALPACCQKGGMDQPTK
jgi:copper chaperone CopZ